MRTSILNRVVALILVPFLITQSAIASPSEFSFSTRSLCSTSHYPSIYSTQALAASLRSGFLRRFFTIKGGPEFSQLRPQTSDKVHPSERDHQSTHSEAPTVPTHEASAPWPLDRNDESALWPYRDSIYQNYYEGVDERNPDWQLREILASTILEFPGIQKDFVFTETQIRPSALKHMTDGMRNNVTPEAFHSLLQTLVRAGALVDEGNDFYRLRVEPEVLAVKFRGVLFMKHQLEAVFKLRFGRDAALRHLLETYGAISERWPLFSVDARKAFTFAVSLLDRHDVERILALIESNPQLRITYPLLDNLWLDYGQPAGPEYIAEHYPPLVDMDVFSLSAEGSRFPLGGLGRVQDYHVEALDFLAQKMMRIYEGEPYYPGTFDDVTQRRDGFEPDSKYAVVTNHEVGDTLTFKLFGNDVQATVYKEQRIYGSATSKEAISVLIQDKNRNGFFTRHRYNYETTDGSDFNGFRMFMANAFLDYWEKIQLEKYDAAMISGKPYKGSWLIANDAQMTGVVKLLRERQSKEWNLQDSLERKRAKIWEKTRIVQVCHTIQNRYDFQRGAKDVTKPGLWRADLAMMVAGWHGAYLAPKLDPSVRVISIFNGSAWTRARAAFIRSWKKQQEAGLLPTDADPDYPTADQMKIHRTDLKPQYTIPQAELDALGITLRSGEPLINPSMPVFVYSGRPAVEKISRTAAHTDNNLRELLNQGGGVNIILSLSPAPGDSAKANFDNLVNLAKRVNSGSKGKLIVRWGNSPEDQAALSEIADVFVQASTPKTEANGSTEVPAVVNGAFVVTPSGIEGGLQMQALLGDFAKKLGSIFVPASDTEMGFREIFSQFLTRWYAPVLDAQGQIQYENGWAVLQEKVLDHPADGWSMTPGGEKQWQGTLWEMAASTVRTSRVNDAKLTSSEMLRQINAEEERIQDPLIALKQFLRQEPGMSAYFNRPFARKRLAAYLLSQPTLATPLKNTDGKIKAFVVRLDDTKPFIVAVDPEDNEYWDVERKNQQVKKGFNLPYVGNQTAFEKFLGPQAAETVFTLWDVATREAYPNPHQLGKDESWWIGIPYPGIQVLAQTPEIATNTRMGIGHLKTPSPANSNTERLESVKFVAAMSYWNRTVKTLVRQNKIKPENLGDPVTGLGNVRAYVVQSNTPLKDSEQPGLLGPTAGAYRFIYDYTNEWRNPKEIPVYVIVINSAMPESLRAEILYEEYWEIYLEVVRNLTHLNASDRLIHQIAGRLRIQKYSEDGHVTPYEKAALLAMSADQLRDILRESHTDRKAIQTEISDFFKRYPTLLKPFNAKLYHPVPASLINQHERLFREYAQSLLAGMQSKKIVLIRPDSRTGSGWHPLGQKDFSRLEQEELRRDALENPGTRPIASSEGASLYYKIKEDYLLDTTKFDIHFSQLPGSKAAILQAADFLADYSKTPAVAIPPYSITLDGASRKVQIFFMNRRAVARSTGRAARAFAAVDPKTGVLQIFSQRKPEQNLIDQIGVLKEILEHIVFAQKENFLPLNQRHTAALLIVTGLEYSEWDRAVVHKKAIVAYLSQWILESLAEIGSHRKKRSDFIERYSKVRADILHRFPEANGNGYRAAALALAESLHRRMQANDYPDRLSSRFFSVLLALILALPHVGHTAGRIPPTNPKIAEAA